MLPRAHLSLCFKREEVDHSRTKCFREARARLILRWPQQSRRVFNACAGIYCRRRGRRRPRRWRRRVTGRSGARPPDVRRRMDRKCSLSRALGQVVDFKILSDCRITLPSRVRDGSLITFTYHAAGHYIYAGMLAFPAAGLSIQLAYKMPSSIRRSATSGSLMIFLLIEYRDDSAYIMMRDARGGLRLRRCSGAANANRVYSSRTLMRLVDGAARSHQFYPHSPPICRASAHENAFLDDVTFPFISLCDAFIMRR